MPSMRPISKSPAQSSALHHPFPRCLQKPVAPCSGNGHRAQINHIHSPVQFPITCRASSTMTDSAMANGKVSVPFIEERTQQACAAGRLSEDGTAFLEEHRIRGYEVGPDQKTTIVTLANLLQVCSSL